MEKEYEYMWYKLLCLYHARTELYDRELTDMKSPNDPTEAYICRQPEKSLSNNYAINLYRYILNFAESKGMPKSVIRENRFGNKYKYYSAQKWIDEYNRLKENGEMNFIIE